MIPLARPWIDEDARLEVARVLASGQLVQGPEVRRFEASLAERTGRRHAVVVSNGTAALFLALRAVGVRAGDEVLCPALTWPSPAHAVRSLGASVRLVDVCPSRWNATSEAFGSARTERTRAAIAIDQFGSPCAFDRISGALPGIPVIRDSACALGATVGGKEAASRGTIACLSFHPRKIVTTGEGGACLTDDDAIASWLRRERNHGQESPGRFAAPGLNYRLTEFAAAIGTHQLSNLNAMVTRRRQIAAIYRRELPLPSQEAESDATPNVQTFGVLVGPARDRWIDELAGRGVQAGILSYALSRLRSLDEHESAHVDRARPGPSCAVAERLADQGLALPMFSRLSDTEVNQVIEAVHDVQRSLPEMST